MKIQYFTTSAVAIVLSALATTAYANNENNSGAYNNSNRNSSNWAPPPPQNRYWQAPSWSNFDFSPSSQQRRPAYGPQGAYQQQAPRRPAPNYRPPSPNYNQQPNMNRPNPNMNRPNPQQQNANRPNPNMAPPRNANRGNPPPPNGPYGYGPDNGASAFNVPGYSRNRNNRNNNGWNNNKFWGNSGPSRWMNPNKNNMEQGWDDMINAPSRMGEMPGGWTAPEVSMPNPVDMGDQMQDNVKDLPEQIKDMDVGN